MTRTEFSKKIGSFIVMSGMFWNIACDVNVMLSRDMEEDRPVKKDDFFIIFYDILSRDDSNSTLAVIEFE